MANNELLASILNSVYEAHCLDSLKEMIDRVLRRIYNLDKPFEKCQRESIVIYTSQNNKLNFYSSDLERSVVQTLLGH